MRGDMVAMLAYEAKVKPAIAKLMDEIDTLSQLDIENAVVPLPWYRTALLRLKAQREQQKQLRDIDENIIWGTVPDPIGWMALYDGDQQYFKITNQFSLEVKYDTLVWFPDTGGVWIETTFCKEIDIRMANLPPVERVTKTQYSEIYRAKINKRM